jgi:hypothetical protein
VPANGQAGEGVGVGREPLRHARAVPPVAASTPQGLQLPCQGSAESIRRTRDAFYVTPHATSAGARSRAAPRSARARCGGRRRRGGRRRLRAAALVQRGGVRAMVNAPFFARPEALPPPAGLACPLLVPRPCLSAGLPDCPASSPAPGQADPPARGPQLKQRSPSVGGRSGAAPAPRARPRRKSGRGRERGQSL